MPRGQPPPLRRITQCGAAEGVIGSETRRRLSPANSPSNETVSPASHAPATASANPLSPVSSASAGPCRLETVAGSFPPGHPIAIIVPRTACGPSSTTTSTPSSDSVAMQSRNATGCRACRRQYAPSIRAPSSSTRPVMLLIRSVEGGERASSPITAAMSSSAGSIRALW